ncbi:hypothetical protein FHR96_001580 [Halomonas organivorans]|uniref:Uncharacterized protein n=1 Tax=Halomonas organivorans TaxID=257772 RepID=A0A7W5BXA7_9GAMM|nr:hypothetical protein [Halomonas organivorans]
MPTSLTPEVLAHWIAVAEAKFEAEQAIARYIG